MAENDLVTIETTWEHDKKLDSLLAICTKPTEGLDEIQDEDDVTELSPIVVKKPDPDSDTCSLFVKQCCRKEVKIDRIIILSDVKTVEVYHVTDGYMFCMRGKSLASKEGETVFKCTSKLDVPCPEVYFKFPVKSNIQTIKLFRLVLDVTLGSEDVHIGGQGSMIDLEKVKGYLGEIPENAQSLFKNMESYQKNQQSMKAAMMTGGNMGSFGMMGLMSALMGGMSPRNGHVTVPSQKSCDQRSEETKSISKTTSQTLPNDLKQKPINGLNSDVTIQRDQEPTQTKMPSGDVLASLMGKMESGRPDSGMFDMLKGICGKVSEHRTPVAKETVVNGDCDIDENTENSTELKPSHEETIRQIVEEQLIKTEERLQVYIDQKLSAFEERMNEKLDRILHVISKSDDEYPP